MKRSNLLFISLFTAIIIFLGFEFKHSFAGAYPICTVLPPTPPPINGNLTCTTPPDLNITFDDNWRSGVDFRWGPSIRGGGTATPNIDLDGKKCLRVTYPQGGEIGDGYQFMANIPPAESYFLTYDFRFGDGFEFVLGGKLPGLCGSECNSGGNKPDGDDGWSTRYMWRENGRGEVYAYNAAQAGTYPDHNYFPNFTFTPGVTYNIIQEVVLNTPGTSNGVVRTWVDGVLMQNLSSFRFRNRADMQVDSFFFSTFFGGSGPLWAPRKDEEILFCDVRAWSGDTCTVE